MTTIEIEWQVVAAILATIGAVIGVSIVLARITIKGNRYKEEHEKMWIWFPSILKKLLGDQVSAEIELGNLTHNSPIFTTEISEAFIPEDARKLLKTYAIETPAGNTSDFLTMASGVKTFLMDEWGEDNIMEYSANNMVDEMTFVLYCTAFVNKFISSQKNIPSFPV